MKIAFEVFEQYEAALKYMATLQNSDPSTAAMRIVLDALKNHIEAGDVTGLAIPNFGGDHE